jgi:predicted alpha/beta-fold hydrolase
MLTFPPFVPHPLLRGGHAQTLSTIFWPGPSFPYRARKVTVAVDRGDTIVLHDDRPAAWQPGDRVAMLSHGLSGCHHSTYMQRVAARLNERGVRTFRVDLRGCGAGMGLARWPYHSGQSEDLAAAVRAIAEECPESPVTAIGFSLSANIVLKLLGETGAETLGNLDSGIAVSPPIDLLECVVEIQRFQNLIYDRYFVRQLLGQIRQREAADPDRPRANFSVKPRRLFDLDDAYTAPMSGFAGAVDYYKKCSAAPLLARIARPTLILSAADDPIIPRRLFEQATLSPAVTLCLAAGGGHLGFLARRGSDPDRWWMDWRVIEWLDQLPSGRANKKAREASPATTVGGEAR